MATADDIVDDLVVRIDVGIMYGVCRLQANLKLASC